MFDGVVLGALPWDTIGLGGIATMTTLTLIRMVISGRFVPRDQVEMLLADLRARVKYMESARTTDAATMSDLVRQNEKLSTQGELSLALLRALQQPGTSSTGNNTAETGSGHVASTQE